jgi:hypothetical protein
MNPALRTAYPALLYWRQNYPEQVRLQNLDIVNVTSDCQFFFFYLRNKSFVLKSNLISKNSSAQKCQRPTL